MEVKRKFWIRRLVALGLLATIGVSIVWLMGSWWLHRLNLPVQKKVISTAKFEIKPVKWISSDEAVFHVRIECFQNLPMLDMDLAKTTLLVDELDNPYKPKYWQHKKTSPNRVEGDLVFTVGETKPKKLILILFSGDETQFVWTL